MNEFVKYLGWLDNHLDPNEDWSDLEYDIINNYKYFNIDDRRGKMLYYRFILKWPLRRIAAKFRITFEPVRQRTLEATRKINKQTKSNHLHLLNELRKKLNEMD